MPKLTRFAESVLRQLYRETADNGEAGRPD